MFQRCKGISLLFQAFGDASSPAVKRELDRDLPLGRAIGTLCQPDRAHATFPQLAQQLVGADALARRFAGRACTDCLRPHRCNRAAHESVGFHCLPCQECSKNRHYIGLFASDALEPLLVLVARQRQRLLQQSVDTLPPRQVGDQGRAN
jgi:hypothetical protein